ncbi:hypothetical protein TGS27_2949 [Geobacillus stearothermophilus]|uniref:Uncharacterized protein n=1 Tax=Geobacillus stearothermophilus TaxID=1422 RepID=A0ABQ7HJR2_GEOSE|nr:hypothetical protein GS8_737 [Geobacillus stearothermophilus]OAO76878.1 hypothetical protein TGS27_2949 [Geobacillus stearothermophilus]
MLKTVGIAHKAIFPNPLWIRSKPIVPRRFFWSFTNGTHSIPCFYL